MIKRILAFVAAASMAAASQGAAVDLSTWSPVILDYLGGQPAASWQIQPGNTVVQQVVNADPSMFMNNLNQTAFTMDGTWKAGNDGDDDYMGFVFGYQNSANFYLFDWKQSSQVYVGRSSTEGMTVKSFTGATGNGLTDLSLAELWENNVDFGDMDVLAKNHGTTKGWEDNKLYNFHLDFNTTPGQFTIEVKDGATVLWNTTISDSTFTGGQFGFYNYSQSAVEYAGFTQTGGTAVPDAGSTLGMLGVALAGLAALKNCRRS